MCRRRPSRCAAAGRRRKPATARRAQAQAAQLGGTRIEIRPRAGEGGKLFGSVTASDVADAVQAQTGVEIDRRRIGLDEPVKELSEVEVPVKLHTDVVVPVTVVVVAA